jgi:hypothetical protein
MLGENFEVTSDGVNANKTLCSNYKFFRIYNNDNDDDGDCDDDNNTNKTTIRN